MNKSKNILVISPFFYPEPIGTGKFNTSIVEELNKKGHKVTIFDKKKSKWLRHDQKMIIGDICDKKDVENVIKLIYESLKTINPNYNFNYIK